jgi:hypothetical protein
MLAYLDDILEPADAQELGKKIEESEFASGLVHRIRGSIGKLRLAAPSVLGKGEGSDPNAVAEYLDNTLPAAAVPDFEKACLESDAQLAEVASCHQILTLVLGEPAQVPPAARQRIYRIGESIPRELPSIGRLGKLGDGHADRLSNTAQGDEPARPVGQGGASASGGWPNEIPDYLCASNKRRVRRLVTTLVLVLLIACGSILVMRPASYRHWLAFWSTVATYLSQNRPTRPGADDAPDQRTSIAQRASADTSAMAPADAPLLTGPDDHAEESSEKHVTEHALAETDNVVGEPPSGQLVSPQSFGQPHHAERADGQTLDDVALPPQPAESLSITGREEELAAERVPAPQVIPAVDPMSGGPDTAADSGLAGASILVESNGGPEGPEGLDQPAVADVGRYVSAGQVVARMDERSGVWTRLATGATLASGDRLIVPPIYRPELLLANGLVLMFKGAAAIHFHPNADSQIPVISVSYGRIVLCCPDEAPVRVALQVAKRRWLLTFADRQSVAAVEVRRDHDPGSNPEQVEASTVVSIWAVEGDVELHPDDQTALRIPPGQAHGWSDRGAVRTIDSPDRPSWIDTVVLREIDRDASRMLEPYLTVDGPIVRLLGDVAHDQRRPSDVRALAAWCLSYFDQFEAVVDAFSSADQRSWWSVHFDGLREALARDPDSAKQVREAIARRRGAHAGELYRMLWAYSADELRAGADKQLVQYLAHESLDFRVLSHENLRRITGATLSYQPWVPSRQRRRSAVRWERLLEAGRIAYR